MSSGSKIKILSDGDLKDLYELPTLDDEERKELFEIEESDRTIIDKRILLCQTIFFQLHFSASAERHLVYHQQLLSQ